MEIIYRKPCPGLADRLAAVMSKCENVSKAFRDAGVQTATAYAIIAGDKPKPSVEVTALRDICRALGCSLADLGVDGLEPQALQPISEAPVGVLVSGVWLHSDRVDFLSCYLHKSGEWYLTNDPAMGRPMRAPDGFLPLPVVEEPAP